MSLTYSIWVDFTDWLMYHCILLLSVQASLSHANNNRSVLEWVLFEARNKAMVWQSRINFLAILNYLFLSLGKLFLIHYLGSFLKNLSYLCLLFVLMVLLLVFLCWCRFLRLYKQYRIQYTHRVACSRCIRLKPSSDYGLSEYKFKGSKISDMRIKYS